jgi:hypothetical protein
VWDAVWQQVRRVAAVALLLKLRRQAADAALTLQCFVRATLPWCGVVWCGVVWCGVVWCGVVWCGVVWCGVVWCTPVRLDHVDFLCLPARQCRCYLARQHVKRLQRLSVRFNSAWSIQCAVGGGVWPALHVM